MTVEISAVMINWFCKVTYKIVNQTCINHRDRNLKQIFWKIPSLSLWFEVDYQAHSVFTHAVYELIEVFV